MIEQLFGSKTRVKLLQLFYGNPNRPFYVREITRKIDEQINSVRRELSNLQSIGIIISESTNNKLYYEVNQKYDYYAPLVTIFGGGTATSTSPGSSAGSSSKAMTKAMPIPADRADLTAIGNVELALYTGQFTRDESSGIDVLLVGDINQTKLQHFMADLESKEGKELRYTMMSLASFKYRLQIKDRFASTIMTAKKQVLVDKQNIL